jgi:hypothetical protein
MMRIKGFFIFSSLTTELGGFLGRASAGAASTTSWG